MKAGPSSFTRGEVRAYYAARVPSLKQRGREWRGPCPIHRGKRDSFSVNANTGLWCCHSECDDGGNVFDLEMKLTGRPFPEARTEVEQIAGRVSLPPPKPNSAESKPRIVAAYDYTDDAGGVLYQQVRYEPKGFRWRRPDGAGGWIWNLHGVRHVPYRLPEILKSGVVYTVEGEKDADRLWDWHIPATTAGAAGQWTDEHSKHLAGKQVVILVDNDHKGRKDAIQRARSLFHVARAVKIVELPGLPEKGDVSDWIGAGHTKEELAELVRTTPVLDEGRLAELERRWMIPASAETPVARRSITDLSQLPSVWTLESDVEWMVEGLVPRGSVTLIAAESGTGKSWLAYALAGSVARGQPFLDKETKPLPVLYCDGENPLYVVKTRLHELGVPETPELHNWGGWNDLPPPGPGEPIVQQFAQEQKGLLIWDSLIDFHDGSEQSATETRKFMNRLRRLANLGGTVLVLHHTGKTESSKPYRGSSDIKASVDTAYTLTGVPVDGKLDRLTLKCFKGRVAPGQDVAMQFRSGKGFVACDLPSRLATTPEAIEEFLETNPGANQKQIVEALQAQEFGKKQITDALRTGVESGRWTEEKGLRNERRYLLAESFEDIEI